jgi:hypothetical protein
MTKSYFLIYTVMDETSCSKDTLIKSIKHKFYIEEILKSGFDLEERMND